MAKLIILISIFTLSSWAQFDDFQEVEEEKWELLFILDANISSAGLNSSENPGFYEQFNAGAYNTYNRFQDVRVEYSIDQVDQRNQRFNDIFLNGYTDNNGNQIPSFVAQTGLNPNNPNDFNQFVYAFATLLDNKPYDSNKNINNVPTSYGVVDALTTSRGGVCVDYALWIGELLEKSGVEGFDIKKHFAPISYSTEGSFHTLGGITNPHTGETLYINYGEVLIEKDGSLVPVNHLMDVDGFASNHTGVLMRRGGIEEVDGQYIPTADEASGIFLTPYGKALQDLIYSNGGFEDLQIKRVSGVSQTEHLTGGISLRKNIIRAQKVAYKEFDLAVSYINLNPRFDARQKQERIMVFGKYKSGSETENLRQNFQVFMGMGTGTNIKQSAVFDMAYQVAPKVEFDLKFLNESANLELSIPTGIRSFVIGERMSDLSWEKEQIQRNLLNVYDNDGNNIGNFNSADGVAAIGGSAAMDNYVIKDPDTGEQWLYSDRGEILPYYYRHTGEQIEETKWGIDGFFRMSSMPTVKMQVSENFSIRASVGAVFAPTPKNIASWRGSEITNPKAYTMKVAPAYSVGARYETYLDNGGSVALDASFSQDYSPYGALNLLNIRTEYVTEGGNAFYGYFTKSKAQENFSSAANNYVMIGAGYRYQDRVSFDAGVVNYGEQQTFQAGIKINF